MLIDTHCHINCMIKENFDRLLTPTDLPHAKDIIQQASNAGVERIINVGTSLIESINCVELAQTFEHCYAAVGIHPNDCTSQWHVDLKEMQRLWFDSSFAKHNNFKIVAIGECGIDRHYPGYDLQRQKDAFKGQIELALTHDLALIIHTRDAGDETLRSLEEYSKENIRGVIHCFSEDQSFAETAISWGFVLGIGGTLTYPKNSALREIFTRVALEKIILETDAPFLPIQEMRGKQNHPKYIKEIAEFLAHLRNDDFKTIAQVTTNTVHTVFRIPL